MIDVVFLYTPSISKILLIIRRIVCLLKKMCNFTQKNQSFTTMRQRLLTTLIALVAIVMSAGAEDYGVHV